MDDLDGFLFRVGLKFTVEIYLPSANLKIKSSDTRTFDNPKMKSVYILFVFGIIISSVLCAIPGASTFLLMRFIKLICNLAWDNGELNIQFDNLDATETGLCQSCFKFKLTEDLDAQWAFRFLYRSFFELDSVHKKKYFRLHLQSGAQCCSFLDTGSSCTYGTGCNQHALVRLPPAMNVTNATSESVSFQGIFSKDSTLSGKPTSFSNRFNVV